MMFLSIYNIENYDFNISRLDDKHFYLISFTFAFFLRKKNSKISFQVNLACKSYLVIKISKLCTIWNLHTKVYKNVREIRYVFSLKFEECRLEVSITYINKWDNYASKEQMVYLMNVTEVNNFHEMI